MWPKKCDSNSMRLLYLQYGCVRQYLSGAASATAVVSVNTGYSSLSLYTLYTLAYGLASQGAGVWSVWSCVSVRC